jgi:MurNAc alpha-1-phosphate uridylyltransferase
MDAPAPFAETPRAAAAKPARAIVLAAGMGKRMRPLTDALPKPLVPLAGRTLLDRALDRLAQAGVTDAVVNVHYRADQIEDHLGRRIAAGSAPRIHISDERDALLDTGGGVKRALGQLGRDPFFVHNSDSIWGEGAGAALDRMAASFDPERMDALLLLAVGASSIGYAGRGDFAMDAGGRLRRRKEGEMTPFVFAGVSLTAPRLLDGMPDGPFSLNLAWDRALEEGRLYGIRHDGVWMHVGTPEAHREAEAWFARGDG